MKPLQDWLAVAFNPAEESPNQIHSDEMAKAYGFRGALVPGVVISNYLTQPALEAWGINWLTHGEAEITVHKPLYDGLNFLVQISNQTVSKYDAQLIDAEGTVCATGHFQLTNSGSKAVTIEPPKYRGDPIMTSNHKAIPAIPPNMLQLQTDGMHALPIRWDSSHRMAYYLKDREQMSSLTHPDKDGSAHTAFLLGITNWVLAENVYMNPWVHLQTQSRFFAAVPYGTELLAECRVDNIFERKGHDFVDVTVNVFEQDSKAPLMSATLRAIYRMRPA